MRKILINLFLCTLFFSCSSLSYNYTQFEFAQEYRKTTEYFDEVLEAPISKSDLKKLEKRFIFLKNQLHQNNENYKRLNEIVVNIYDEKIDEYLMIVKDLQD